MSKLKKALQKAKNERMIPPELPSKPDDQIQAESKMPPPAVESQTTESKAVPPVIEPQTVESKAAPPVVELQTTEPEPKNGGEQNDDKKGRPSERKDSVRIQYTRTQVKPVDPNVLKKNKIVSLFHDHQMTDQINLLRAQVMNRLKKIEGNTLLITSANPGEGKTFTSINLAISIAKELDRTVLLIDADLKNPTFNHFDFANDFFGVDIHQGLADYLLGEAELPDLLINPGIEKLTILPGGRSLPNSSEVLGSPKMETLINDIKSRYKEERVIIFDTSSLLNSPDPLVFSHLVDGILLVIESERTTPKQLKRALELLNGKTVIGTVINKNRGDRNSNV